METLGGEQPGAAYDGLFALYRDLDAACATTPGCPPGCGACCETPARAIEATVAEMLPLADHLYARGLAESALDRALAAGEDGVCILHESDPEARLAHGGACTAYALRPLVCRLFGSAGVRDKHGRVRFSPCLRLTSHSPVRTVPPGLDPPVFSDWRMRLAVLDPTHPINLAIAVALDRTMRAGEREL